VKRRDLLSAFRHFSLLHDGPRQETLSLTSNPSRKASPALTLAPSGDAYSFETINGGEATKNAHTVFAEEIALADQSEILDSVGRSVWSNEGPPSRQSGQDTPEMRGEDKEDKAAA